VQNDCTLRVVDLEKSLSNNWLTLDFVFFSGMIPTALIIDKMAAQKSGPAAEVDEQGRS
jgi:hypothetical protein